MGVVRDGFLGPRLNYAVCISPLLVVLRPELFPSCFLPRVLRYSIEFSLLFPCSLNSFPAPQLIAISFIFNFVSLPLSVSVPSNSKSRTSPESETLPHTQVLKKPARGHAQLITAIFKNCLCLTE